VVVVLLDAVAVLFFAVVVALPELDAFFTVVVLLDVEAAFVAAFALAALLAVSCLVVDLLTVS